MHNKASQRDIQIAARFACPCRRRYVEEKHMKIFSGLLFVLMSNVSHAEGIDDILKRSPIEAAQKAHGAGDTSLLTVPGCFNGMPGYKGQFGPPKKWRKFWKSCEDLFGVEQYKKIQDLEEWAKLYNGYILEHREK